MEVKSFIRYLQQRWILCHAFQPPIVGCTDAEIEQLQAAQGVDYLPELYREFMRQLGHEDGGLGKFLEADLSCSHVLTFKSAQNGYCLPLLRVFGVDKEAFVFYSDNTNFLYFFDTRDRSDDPVVFSIHENSGIGDPHVKVKWGSLSSILVDFVEGCFDHVNWKETDASLD